MGHAPCHKLGDDKASLYRFPEAHAICQEEPHTAHAKGTHHGDELVGLDAEAPGLNGEQGIGTQGLLEQKRLVVDEPVGERSCTVETKRVYHRLHRFEGVEEVQLFATDGPFETPEAIEGLGAQLLDCDDLPAEATRHYFGSREE